MNEHSTFQRLTAELTGTFLLVLAGCGTAILSADFPTAGHQQVGVGFLGVAAAFGLTLTVLVFTLGPVSGGHFNPAVTLGLAVAGRFAWRQVPSYAAAQLTGAVGGAALLYVIAAGRPGFHAASSGFASNGYAARSPGGYSLGAAFLTETVMTMVFLAVILVVTGRNASPGIAAAVIGGSLMIIHLVSIPVTNTSVNPARSLGPALCAGGGALAQLWLFFAAPLLGAALVGAGFPLLTNRRAPGSRQHRDTHRTDTTNATPVPTVA
ncbi:aquaporin Z [Actinoplanes sp. TFC3]|uniref:aquaporin Z n=1 Tax=Actinoplanes sp. TFC3 TaxID=1710355 RepID=UPI00083525E8|nr:aquaporin Z [Actinoplanes sp. TFC3]